MRRLRQRATYSAAVMTAIAALALGGCTIPTDGGNGDNQAQEQARGIALEILGKM